jgi:hypothetical protein
MAVKPVLQPPERAWRAALSEQAWCVPPATGRSRTMIPRADALNLCAIEISTAWTAPKIPQQHLVFGSARTAHQYDIIHPRYQASALAFSRWKSRTKSPRWSLFVRQESATTPPACRAALMTYSGSGFQAIFAAMNRETGGDVGGTQASAKAWRAGRRATRVKTSPRRQEKPAGGSQWSCRTGCPTMAMFHRATVRSTC